MMIDHLEEIKSEALRLVYFPPQLFALSNLLDLYPHSLFFCNKHVIELFLFFDCVKIVNNDTNEKIDDELTTDDHENNEIDDKANTGISLWLLSYTSIVNT